MTPRWKINRISKEIAKQIKAETNIQERNKLKEIYFDINFEEGEQQEKAFKEAERYVNSDESLANKWYRQQLYHQFNNLKNSLRVRAQQIDLIDRTMANEQEHMHIDRDQNNPIYKYLKTKVKDLQSLSLKSLEELIANMYQLNQMYNSKEKRKQQTVRAKIRQMLQSEANGASSNNLATYERNIIANIKYLFNVGDEEAEAMFEEMYEEEATTFVPLQEREVYWL